jgi:hypothetical protein
MATIEIYSETPGISMDVIFNGRGHVLRRDGGEWFLITDGAARRIAGKRIHEFEALKRALLTLDGSPVN